MANDVTGAVAKIEPAKPDGTAAYPYADVNQCPPNTDIVIWPEEWHSRSRTSPASSLSVLWRQKTMMAAVSKSAADKRRNSVLVVEKR